MFLLLSLIFVPFVENVLIVVCLNLQRSFQTNYQKSPTISLIIIMTNSSVRLVVIVGQRMALHFQKIKQGQKMECIIVIFAVKEKEKENAPLFILMKTFSLL